MGALLLFIITYNIYIVHYLIKITRLTLTTNAFAKNNILLLLHTVNSYCKYPHNILTIRQRNRYTQNKQKDAIQKQTNTRYITLVRQEKNSDLVDKVVHYLNYYCYKQS